MVMDGAENRFENPLYAVVEARKVELSVPSTEPLPDNTELTIQQQEQIEGKNESEICYMLYYYTPILYSTRVITHKNVR